MERRIPFAAAALLALVPAAPAAAHLHVTSPPSRHGASVLEEPPCGVAGGTRSDNVSVFEPGRTIEVVWDEYIDHPGHYRIAFDADGDDDFVDPATMTEMYSNDAVLLDGITDRDVSGDDTIYRVNVTLPDIECDNCTLQVIQVMYDKPPYTIPGNDIYYQCADLVLRRTGGADGGPGVDSGPVPDAGGTTADAGTGAGGGMGGRTEGREGGGCCAIAPGAGRVPAGGLVAATLLACLAGLRRRSRPKQPRRGPAPSPRCRRRACSSSVPPWSPPDALACRMRPGHAPDAGTTRTADERGGWIRSSADRPCPRGGPPRRTPRP